MLDITPARTVFCGTNQCLASRCDHWFFLSERYDRPGRPIGPGPL
jgi:hypothetical protein